VYYLITGHDGFNGAGLWCSCLAADTGCSVSQAGYVETDPLSGDDPDSASKAMADLLGQSWIRRFPALPPPLPALATSLAAAMSVVTGCCQT
jgi:hypothetical protein